MNPHQLQKKLAEVEDNIHQLETRHKQITADIEAFSAKGDAARVSQLGAEYTQVENDLHAAMSLWEQLAE